MTDEQRGAHLAAVGVTSLEPRPPHTARRVHRARATIALLAFLASLAGCGLICQAALAAPRSPLASHAGTTAGAPRGSMSPLNPAFTRYVRLRTLGPLRAGNEKHDFGLIPTPIVNYTSPSTSGSITFTPVALAFGSATITVTVNDGQARNNTVIRTFTVTVVNDRTHHSLINPLTNLVAMVGQTNTFNTTATKAGLFFSSRA